VVETLQSSKITCALFFFSPMKRDGSLLLDYSLINYLFGSS